MSNNFFLMKKHIFNWKIHKIIVLDVIQKQVERIF